MRTRMRFRGNPWRRLALGLVLSGAGAAQAAGFYLQELGTPHSVGTAGVANVTNTEGADAAWSNPAGMVFSNGDQMLVGLQAVVPRIRFDLAHSDAGWDDGGNAGMNTLIPSLYYMNRLSDRFAFGFSATGSMGGGVDYGKDFAGRYQMVRAELAVLAISPSVAWKVGDGLSVGAGVSALYTLYEQDIAIRDRVLISPTLDGGDGMLRVEKADGWDHQFFFSVNWIPREDLLVSLLYRSEADTDLTGDVRLENLRNRPGLDEVDVAWTAPQWVEAGVRYRWSESETFYFNAGWQDWSEFSDNRLAFSGDVSVPVAMLDRNWRDTWHAGIAWSHRNERLATSLGLSYESSPVRDEDRTFDLPVDAMYKVSGSVGWKHSSRLDFFLGATLYLVDDAPVTATAQGTTVSGRYDANTILFLSGTLRYRF